MRTAVHVIATVAALLVAGCATSPEKAQDTVFYPPLPEIPRIQFLTTITTEDDLGGASLMRQFLTDGTQNPKRFIRPWDMAHEKGKIYVIDKRYSKVIIADLGKRSLSIFPDKRLGALQNPMGIAIADNGYKYVADMERGQIVAYDEKNEFVRVYGEPKQYHVTDVAVYENRIYVCENKANEIVVLDRDSGDVITRIGEKGKEEGQLHRPSHVAVDKDGNLFVTDVLNFRIQMFDKDGKFVRSFGEAGAGPGGNARPKGLDIDRDGHFYLADAGMEIVQIFDIETSNPLLAFGKYATGPGSTYMPGGVHIDYDNVDAFAKYADPDFKLKYLIYVANTLGEDKLNVYGFGEWTGQGL